MPHMSPFAIGNPFYTMGSMQKLSKGITGHLVEGSGNCIYVITFMSEVAGKGNAGRFIDELQEKYDVVKFPAVISRQVAEMLNRRGFKKKWEYVAALKGHSEVYGWRKQKIVTG
jgi:hypothetical protein